MGLFLKDGLDDAIWGSFQEKTGGPDRQPGHLCTQSSFAEKDVDRIDRGNPRDDDFVNFDPRVPTKGTGYADPAGHNFCQSADTSIIHH